MKLQFSLRTLMIVVTLLAVPLGYVRWQAKVVRERKALLQLVLESGGFYLAIRKEMDHLYFGTAVYADFKSGGGKENRIEIPRSAEERIDQEGPGAIRRWLGDEAIGAIMAGKNFSEDDFARLKASFPEAQ